MSAERLVDQPSPAKICGIQLTLYSIPPPQTAKSVTVRRPADCGKNAPKRTLSPLVMLAFAPAGSAMAAPATSVSAAIRRWPAFKTLILLLLSFNHLAVHGSFCARTLIDTSWPPASHLTGMVKPRACEGSRSNDELPFTIQILAQAARFLHRSDIFATGAVGGGMSASRANYSGERPGISGKDVAVANA